MGEYYGAVTPEVRAGGKTPVWTSENQLLCEFTRVTLCPIHRLPALRCHALHQYLLEMLYDIKFIYMPGGDRMKEWIEESVMTLIKQYDNYILDEYDIVANELAETGKCDRKMFQKFIDIKLDLNDVAVEWATNVMLYEKMDRKVVHYMPVVCMSDRDILENGKKILVSTDDYEEYIKLKRDNMIN